MDKRKKSEELNIANKELAFQNKEEKIRILHLEDSLKDSELIRSLIEDGEIGYEYFFADDKKDFLHILETENIDIILSDYNLPDYNGIEALKVAREKYPHIPFIFVSGIIGEDAAINSLLNGATDYVLKNKLVRLVPAIKRALYESELKSKSEKTEDKLIIANKELAYQNEEKGKRAAELIIANKELLFQNEEKEKRAAELIIANKELSYQNEEKEKRAAELIIANKELSYQNKEKEKRASELIIANKELAFQNVEKEKRVEELRETNEYLENLFHYANAPIIVWDTHFKITRFNPAFETLTGRKAENVIGQSIEILFPEDLVESSMMLIRKAQEGARLETVEIKIQHLNGSERTLQCNSASVMGTDGKTLIATIAQGQDITIRKQAEEKLKITLENLEQSNQELEQFAYVASHDLQEPLRMVSSYTQLLERRYKDKLDQDANEFIQYAVDGANRMQKLINDLLDYSRITSRGKAFTQVDISNVLGQVISNLQQLINENTALITNEGLPILKADESQIMRVFQNLIGNAIKFKKKTELPKIHISCKKEDDFYEFTVRDNGIGMDMQFHDRVFTIFQRLHSKEEYPGTGIGLSICKRIVERHGGKIWFESKEDEGTTFYFTLKI